MTYAGSASDGSGDSRVFDACLAIALEAEALARCAAGHPHLYRTCDNEAEARAFARATIAQSAGELVGLPLDRVIGQLGAILDGAGRDCPACAAEARPAA